MIASSQNIVLIGMPGCGKTTIGKILSSRLNRKFIDVDEYIEKCSGKTVTQIFTQGEEVFRTLEKEAILELSKEKYSVISTGGGVIKNYLNIEALKENGVIIFIDRPIENIVADLDSESRPLLKDGVERLYTLFEERYELYKKYCDFQIVNDDDIEKIIEKIIEVI
jgi:shikimate kinase